MANDYMVKFAGAEAGAEIELGFNYYQPHPSKELFIAVRCNDVEGYAGIPVDTARAFRDHLNFLLGEQ